MNVSGGMSNTWEESLACQSKWGRREMKETDQAKRVRLNTRSKRWLYVGYGKLCCCRQSCISQPPLNEWFNFDSYHCKAFLFTVSTLILLHYVILSFCIFVYLSLCLCLSLSFYKCIRIRINNTYTHKCIGPTYKIRIRISNTYTHKCIRIKRIHVCWMKTWNEKWKLADENRVFKLLLYLCLRSAIKFYVSSVNKR